MPRKGFNKPAQERRIHTAKTLLTRDEYEHFQLCVDSSTYRTDAAYLRALISGARIPARRSALQHEILRDLSRIGNNLNQLTRLANSGTRINEVDLQITLDEFRQTLRTLTLKR